MDNFEQFMSGVPLPDLEEKLKAIEDAYDGGNNKLKNLPHDNGLGCTLDNLDFENLEKLKGNRFKGDCSLNPQDNKTKENNARKETTPHVKTPLAEEKSQRGETSKEPMVWKQLFASTKSETPMEYYKPKMIDNGKKIRVNLPKHVVESGIDKWKDCLVGYFVGKRLPFSMVKHFFDNNKKRFGNVEVSSNSHGCFILRFENEFLKNDAIEEDLGLLRAAPLFLLGGHPNESPSKNYLESAYLG